MQLHAKNPKLLKQPHRESTMVSLCSQPNNNLHSIPVINPIIRTWLLFSPSSLWLTHKTSAQSAPVSLACNCLKAVSRFLVTGTKQSSTINGTVMAGSPPRHKTEQCIPVYRSAMRAGALHPTWVSPKILFCFFFALGRKSLIRADFAPWRVESLVKEAFSHIRSLRLKEQRTIFSPWWSRIDAMVMLGLGRDVELICQKRKRVAGEEDGLVPTKTSAKARVAAWFLPDCLDVTMPSLFHHYYRRFPAGVQTLGLSKLKCA